jgi:hypothetical protein
MSVDESWDDELSRPVYPLDLGQDRIRGTLLSCQDRLNLLASDQYSPILNETIAIVIAIAPGPDPPALDQSFHRTSSALPLAVTIADHVREGNRCDYLVLLRKGCA